MRLEKKESGKGLGGREEGQKIREVKWCQWEGDEVKTEDGCGVENAAMQVTHSTSDLPTADAIPVCNI